MGFLTDVVAETRRELRERPPDERALAVAAAAAPAPRDLSGSLRLGARARGVALIAEVKRASPSAGAIAPDADPVAQAVSYAGAGATAVSVLTESRHFGGSFEDLARVREAVDLPVLCKGFVVEPVQILQARAGGADAVLLITAALNGSALSELIGSVRALGMEPLVETHSELDLERALGTEASLIGVNARDLESLVVDVARARERVRAIPADRVAVLESGIAEASDVTSAVAAGASAVLVGEALMRAGDPGAKVAELLAGVEPLAARGGAA
jgi:indole-3-glycerol phosphate synthase